MDFIPFHIQPYLLIILGIILFFIMIILHLKLTHQTSFYNIDYLDSYNPSIINLNQHLSAIYCHFFRKNKEFLNTYPYNEEHIYNQDYLIVLRKYIINDKYPTIILFLGVCGKIEAEYISNLIVNANHENFNVVATYLQSQIDPFVYKPLLKSPKFLCFNDYKDIEATVNHILNTFSSNIYLVGYSAGGFLLGKYLQECKISSRIKGAICISNPWKARTLCHSLNLPFNKLIYNKHFMKHFKNLAYQYTHLYGEFKEMHPSFDESKLLSSSNIIDFIENFNIHLYNVNNIDEYIDNASFSINNIDIPLLILHAKDDPICPYSDIPLDEIKKKSNISLIATDSGGHLGWINYTENIILKYITKLEKSFF